MMSRHCAYCASGHFREVVPLVIRRSVSLSPFPATYLEITLGLKLEAEKLFYLNIDSPTVYHKCYLC